VGLKIHPFGRSPIEGKPLDSASTSKANRHNHSVPYESGDFVHPWVEDRV
jgi:hypothetical protein